MGGAAEFLLVVVITEMSDLVEVAEGRIEGKGLKERLKERIKGKD